MSDTVSLGTVGAAANLDLRPLQAAVKDAGKLLRGLAESLKAVGDLKFSGPVLSQLEGIGDTARIVIGDVQELRGALKTLALDLGLKPVAEQITRIGVNAVQASGGLDDLATGLKLVKGEGQGVSAAFVGVKDTLREVRDAASSGAGAFGRLSQKLDTAGTAGKAAAGGIGAAGTAAEDAGLAAEAATAGFGGLKAELSGVAGAGNRAALALERATRAGKGAGVAAGAAGLRAGRGSVAAGMGLSALRGLGGLAMNAAGGVTVIAGLSTRNAVEYGGQAQQIAGNTNMSAADRKAMYQSGLSAMRQGSDGESAMRSYMHVANHQFTGADASNINDMAVKMNVGTGANTELSGQVVAALMHQMGLTGSKGNVSRVGNMIHQATASGDMNLEKYNQYGAPAVGKALALGNSPADSAAFLTALTQNNVRIPQAATNLAGISWQITHPNPKAWKSIDKAGLSGYFGAGKLKKYGLHEIIEKTFQGVGGDQNRLMDIFGNKQGGFGALVATSAKGAADYKKQLYDPKVGNLAALQGKLKPVEQRYAEMSATPAQQSKALAGSIKADSIEVGTDFIPVLTKLLPLLKAVSDDMLKAVDAVSKLPMPVQEAVLGLGAFRLATFALGNPLVGLGEGIGTLIKGLAGAEGGAAALSGLGAAAGPIGLAAAAVIAFGVAWKTNFGQVREAFAPFLADVKRTFGGSGKEIQDFINVTLPDLKAFIKEVEPIFKVGFGAMAMQIKLVFDVIKAVVRTALALVGGIIRTGLALMTGDWKGAWEGFKSIFTGAWAAILGLANDIAPKLVAIITQLGRHLGEAALSAGQQVISGIASGITGGIGHVAEAARSLAASIPATVAAHLEIHSPSRVMHKLGLDTAEGLARGIRDGKVSVDAASKLLASSPKEIVRQAITESRKNSERHHAAGEYAATVAMTPEEKQLRRLGQDHAAGLINEKTYTDALVQVWEKYHRQKEAAYAGHLKRLGSLRQRFAGFMTGLADMTASASGRDAKASKTPDTLAVAREDRIAAAGDAFGGQLGQIDTFRKSGQFSPAQIRDAIRSAKNTYMAEYHAAWDEYDHAVKSQADKVTSDYNALQVGIARATAHANAHTWKDGEAQAKEYFQSLRDEALDSFNQVEARIEETPGLTDAQKSALHTGNKSSLTSANSDIDLQESDGAARRKLDALKARRDQAEEAFGGGGSKQDYANSLGGILGQIPQNSGPEGEGLRHQVQDELNKLARESKGTVSELGKNIADSLGNAFDGAMSHAKKFKSFWKEMMESLKLDSKQIFLSFLGKEFKDGLLSLFTHKNQGAVPQKNINPTGGGAGTSLTGINGPVGGGIGGLLGTLGGFLPGGSLLGKLFSGGGLFGGLRKIFHFSGGGFVPGTGFHDSVPAMLTPGERVLTKAQQAAGAGGSPRVTINHYGNVSGVEDVHAMHGDWAWGVSQALATAVPGT